MTTIQRVRMTHRDYSRLHQELAGLRPRFTDGDPNSLARQPARQARIREIEDLLTSAAIVGEEAAFDPVAQRGMLLTIRYDDTGETETFLLGRMSVQCAGVRVYPMASPLGRAISGARPGDQRIYGIPNGTPRLVTLLKAVPYGQRPSRPRQWKERI